ncbi:hypothetical protein A6R68_21960 [Neotoma lepida]|uniref:Ribosomal protein L23/L25 N-terminal domain-containing protein n=1 Tax=Neotoma lepida TaxID=56216 RepID=A0A1A6HN31_NEOLE|nr:hypothetical protein A6R68_21960 [Neotoma lepida]
MSTDGESLEEPGWKAVASPKASAMPEKRGSAQAASGSWLQGFGQPSVYHAAIVIFFEFFAWGLLTTPMLTVSALFQGYLGCLQSRRVLGHWKVGDVWIFSLWLWMPFSTDVKANKHQIKQAVKKLYDIDVAKVNTLIRPDGEKKAYVYVLLAPDYDALDVTNKIGII